jgi:hypothetical protein
MVMVMIKKMVMVMLRNNLQNNNHFLILGEFGLGSSVAPLKECPET